MKNRFFTFHFSLFSYAVGMFLLMGVSTTAYGQIVKGKVFGGGQLAQVNGGTAETACNVTLCSGEVYGKVYGAGEGVKIDDPQWQAADRPDVAKVTGNVKVNLTSGRNSGGIAWKDVFGGGALAKVEGSSYVNMSGGHIAANMYGGGEGDIKRNTDDSYAIVDNAPIITYADVTRNTNVTISGGTVIWNRTSLTHPINTSTTIYTYKKTFVEEGVNYETTAATFEAAKAELEAAGYTEVSITASSGPIEGIYTYTVNRTSTLTEEVLSTNIEKIDKLVSDDFTKDEGNTKEEISNLVEGDIVYWDTNNRETNYFNESDPDHKIHNELFYDEEKHTFRIEHNIFGGGYIACNVDTAKVTMTQGLGDNELTSTAQWKESFEDTKNPHFYAFGGGYGAYTTVRNTVVNVNVGDYDHNLDANTEGQRAKRRATSNGNGGDNDLNMGIYNNQYGIAGATVLGVLGGSYAGFVEQNTDVTVGGETFACRVYGGGFGQLEAYNKLKGMGDNYLLSQQDMLLSSKTRENLGEVGGNTLVKITGANIYGNVYGGGAGVPSNIPEGETQKKDFTMGAVKGVTEVHIREKANVFGSVFGGGEIANVNNELTDAEGNIIADATKVFIEGGNIYNDVYGGGHGDSIVNVAVATGNTIAIGKVNGNTRVSIYDTYDNPENGTPTLLYSPRIYGNVYGGCAYGLVTKTSDNNNGNTNIVVDGGKIGNNIFGGGRGHIDMDGKITSADIAGTTSVEINGGEYMWREISDENGNIKMFQDETIPLTTILSAKQNPMLLVPYLQKVTDFWDMYKREYSRDHNIYGGGNLACNVTGDATVTVNHGMLADDLGNADDSTWSLAALLRYLAVENGNNYQFGVFGGGYGANTTVANTNVNIQMGNNDADKAVWNNFAIGMFTKYADVSETDKELIYGGTIGENVYTRFLTSRMCQTFGVPYHTVLTVAGGGMAGYVNGNANVVVKNHSGALRVFGGGIGELPADAATINQTAADAITYGSVGGNTEVTVSGGVISRNVYGGGAGIESFKQAEGFIDFPNIARVGKVADNTTGKATVTIDGYTTGTLVYGKVFGGGDVANVSKTDVTVQGGCVFQHVFAGGSGRLVTQCNDYQRLGKVDGNTKVTVKNGYYTEELAQAEYDAAFFNPGRTQKTTEDTHAPWIWNRIYGGGQNGSVGGNTNVFIEGGNIGYNIFGGGWGNVIETEDAEGNIEKIVTYANVGTLENGNLKKGTGDTHITITEGEFCLSQLWNADKRNWEPSHKKDGKTYTSQYNPETQKFYVNHNVYAGANAAGNVYGNTYIQMDRGLIRTGTSIGHEYETEKGIFATDEWREIYEKVGSPHFCVFGGGYGENTHVHNNSNVNVDLHGATDVDLTEEDPKSDGHELRFQGGQTVMDIAGGGYAGEVMGATNVNVSGNTYARRIYGGAFYAPCGETNVNVMKVNVDDVFGGGMMGDVIGKANVNIGVPASNSAYSDEKKADENKYIFVNHDVYGGNDVSGDVKGQIKLNLYGGMIYNNVHGAGNGNYLYALADNDTIVKVTAHEDYVLDNVKYDLVYMVPPRTDFMINKAEAPSATRLVNINSYRPRAQFTEISLMGTDPDHPLTIRGSVFGGGNTATLSPLNGNKPKVVFNIGSHVRAGQVFMGADGDAMFNDERGFMNAFQKINSLELTDEIRNKWDKDPTFKIPMQYVPVKPADRYKVYPYLLDLYFAPVEMSTQATLNWCNTFTANADAPNSNEGALTNTRIGSFFCGGNRGNMNVEPATEAEITAHTADGNATNAGQVINYEFPEGLTITEKIVGGCNMSSLTPKGSTVSHTGGYLLGQRGGEIETNLLVQCLFDVEDPNNALKEGRNVYGGCYKTGTTRGDIAIDFRGDMLAVNNISQNIEQIREDGLAIANIYGAGYGNETFVYGNTDITMGKGVPYVAATATTPEKQCTANYIFGGGQRGNLIGNSKIHILNGHLASSAVGGSYSGLMWGSTQVLVGYPKYYVCKKSAEYQLDRADKWNTEQKNHDGTDVIKRSIFLMEGDIVAEEVYQTIVGYKINDGTFSDADLNTFFEENTTDPTTDGGLSDWDDVNISLYEAAYGGGYSLADATGEVGAGGNTVRKYSTRQNINEDLTPAQQNALFNGDNASIGYGGNTTVLIWDNSDAEQTKDHITVSQSWKEVTGLTDGADLYGYYRQLEGGSYAYCFEKGKYFYNKENADFKTTFSNAVESNSEGGMFGDGHLSYAEGFRAGELHGYGFAEHNSVDAKVLNTFQRMDMLRVEDCAVVLLGARDYTTINGISTTPYSIARIGELQMIAKNVTNAGKDKIGDLSSCEQVHSRNFLGLSSSIHYVGAVNSSVDFNDTYRYGNKNGAENSNKIKDANISYRQEKQSYITEYIENNAIKDEELFQKRNDGTAANMIGISSGYALKVQNAQTITPDGVYSDDNYAEKFFYGPIIGVVEMNLINVHPDEGGGYVYADNIHRRKATPAAAKRKAPLSGWGNGANEHSVPTAWETEEDFLETSGNFVFPYNEELHRYIVDDCFSVGWLPNHVNAPSTRAGEPHIGEPIDEAHYWYVTGYNYYYNAHITGYTFDKSTKTEIGGEPFNSDTEDGLLVLTGVKPGQPVNLLSFTWNDTHKNGDNGFIACDLQTEAMESAMNNAGISAEDKYRGKGNALESSTDDHYVYNGYNLFFSAGSKLEDNVYDDRQAHWANLPMTVGLPYSSTRRLDNLLQIDNASLTFQLRDMVDNSGNNYFTRYMKQPCTATLVLTAPAMKDLEKDANGEYVTREATQEDVDAGFATELNQVIPDFQPVYGYIAIKEFYTKANDSETFTKVEDGTKLTSGSTYYYFGNGNMYHPFVYSTTEAQNQLLYKYDSDPDGDTQNQTHVYASVNGQAPGATITTEEYNKLDGEQKLLYQEVNGGYQKIEVPEYTGSIASGKENNKDKIFYIRDQRYFSYTIDLTIDYVQGPDYTGSIEIGNCALPGERINVNRGTFQLSGDRTFSITDSYWRFAPGKIDTSTGKIVLDKTDPNKVFTYKVGSPWEAEKVDPEKGDLNETSPIFNESLDNTNDNSINLPAYYFMNGYSAQYIFKVNGIKNHEYEVEIQADNTLRIHNYHKMQPRKTGGDIDPDMDLYLDRAAARAAVETTFAAPRIYLTDGEDLNRFGTFIDDTRYNNGKDMEFFLQEDIEVPFADRFGVGAYVAPTEEFAGTFHGDGHSFIFTNNTKKEDRYILTAISSENTEGHIHNLGVINGTIKQGDKLYDITQNTQPTDNSKYHCNFNFADYQHNVVYSWGGKPKTDYTVDDWNLGKVTYDLNQYYLKERYDRNADGTDTYTATDYVEKLYQNGDYLYARYNAENSNYDDEFLRTNAAVNYRSTETWHRFDVKKNDNGVNHITHPIDQARYVEHTPADKVNLEIWNYHPLFEEAHLDQTTYTGNTSTATVKRNDYLFFGQMIVPDAQASEGGVYPHAFATNVTSNPSHNANASNRVYRTFGYYGDKNDDAYHFNLDAYAIQPTLRGLTAIDFAGEHNDNVAWATPTEEWKTGTDGIFYPHMQDMPDKLNSFTTTPEVTRNLLVYTDADNSGNNVSYSAVRTALTYTETAEENSIKGHQIVGTYSGTWSSNATLLHLVDAKNISKVGGDYANCDFNAPLQFTATKAWYIRQPALEKEDKSSASSDITGYVDKKGEAWETLTLPFSATKTEASHNGEITHFYLSQGTAGADGYGEETGLKKEGKFGHQYWLREMNSIDASKPDVEAQFLSLQAANDGSYQYTPSCPYYLWNAVENKYFKPGDDGDYDKNDEVYTFNFAKYPSPQAYTPYIVSFPGKLFYEFDLSGEWDGALKDYYEESFDPATAPQTITFSAVNANVGVTDDNTGSMTNTIGSYGYHGVTMKTTGVLALNDKGTAFGASDDESGNTVALPFRGYMSKASSARQRGNIIYIGNGGDDELLQPQQGIEESLNDFLDIRVMGKKIIVNSSCERRLRLYTAAGAYDRTLEIPAGESRFTINANGVYLLGNQKILIK